MALTQAEIQARYKRRQKENNCMHVDFWADAELSRILEKAIAEKPHLTKKKALQDILLESCKSQHYKKSKLLSIYLMRDENNKQTQQYLKVLNACVEAGITPPIKVCEYFGINDIQSIPYDYQSILKVSYEPDVNEDGDIEINIHDLPIGIKTIIIQQ